MIVARRNRPACITPELVMELVCPSEDGGKGAPAAGPPSRAPPPIGPALPRSRPPRSHLRGGECARRCAVSPPSRSPTALGGFEASPANFAGEETKPAKPLARQPVEKPAGSEPAAASNSTPGLNFAAQQPRAAPAGHAAWRPRRAVGRWQTVRACTPGQWIRRDLTPAIVVFA